MPARPRCEVVPAARGLKPRGAMRFLVWVTGAPGGIAPAAHPALNCPRSPEPPHRPEPHGPLTFAPLAPWPSAQTSWSWTVS